jgi:hypothetical protein
LRPPSTVWKRTLLSLPRRATTHAALGPAALTLMIEHHRVGRPRAWTVRHVCPASVVTCATVRAPPATIHQTRVFTMLTGHEAVE